MIVRYLKLKVLHFPFLLLFNENHQNIGIKKLCFYRLIVTSIVNVDYCIFQALQIQKLLLGSEVILRFYDPTSFEVPLDCFFLLVIFSRVFLFNCEIVGFLFGGFTFNYSTCSFLLKERYSLYDSVTKYRSCFIYYNVKTNRKTKILKRFKSEGPDKLLTFLLISVSIENIVSFIKKLL